MDLARILRDTRTIAILGARDRPEAPAYFVPEYLVAQGYRILPVNPGLVGTSLWGEPVRATLAEIDEPIDLVDVFRRSDAIPGHVADILAMRPLPRVVWLQEGVVNDEAARDLEAHGIVVVQDACTLAVHRSEGVGLVGTQRA